MRLVASTILGLVLVAGPASAEGPPAAAGRDDSALKSELELLGTTPIYFAHHSVGDDLLAGVKVLSSEAGVPVRIEETRPGKNGDPDAKIDDWLAHALKEEGSRVVVMKLCFADFGPKTDVDGLFKHYAAAVERLRKERPDLTILHVTAPATVMKDDLTTKAKRLIGREVWEDGAIQTRHAYNEKLRAAFRAEPFFDLAALESRRPDGGTEMGELGGKKVELLATAYSKDGGHLNALGQRTGARGFVHALAEAVRAHVAKVNRTP